MTASTTARMAPMAPFADAEQPLPRRFEHVTDLALLVLVVLGDLASFRIVLALATNGSDVLVWLLTLSMTALAVLCMHQAGRIVRDRHAGAHTAGRLVVWSLMALWLAMGFAAAALRVLHPITSTAPPDLLTGAPPALSGPSLSTWMVALALLVVYLAGGVAAFAIGHRSHNPLRSSVLYERRVVARRRRQLRRAEARGNRLWGLRRRQARTSSSLHQAEARHAAEVARVRAEAETLRGMTPALVLGCVTAARERLADQRRELVGLAGDRGVTAAHLRSLRSSAAPAEPTPLPGPAERQARARAVELRQVARLRMAERLGEPAATTGLFGDSR